MKSIELIENSKRESYLQRVENFKVNTERFANAGYGVMFKYGGWGYPEQGENKKDTR